jgi:hypothetical protein
MGSLVDAFIFFPQLLAWLGFPRSKVLNSCALINHSRYTSQAKMATTMMHTNLTTNIYSHTNESCLDQLVPYTSVWNSKAIVNSTIWMPGLTLNSYPNYDAFIYVYIYIYIKRMQIEIRVIQPFPGL